MKIKSKILFIVCIVLMFAMCIVSNADELANVNIISSKEKLKKGDEFQVIINNSNFKDKEIVAIDAILDYDDSVLMLVSDETGEGIAKVEGQNNWSTTIGLNTKKIITYNLDSDNGDMVKITFKVLKDTVGKTDITLKDVNCTTNNLKKVDYTVSKATINLSSNLMMIIIIGVIVILVIILLVVFVLKRKRGV